MKTLVWFFIIVMFFYSIGLGMKLWKDKNKIGSIATFILAISLVGIPLFSTLKLL